VLAEPFLKSIWLLDVYVKRSAEYIMQDTDVGVRAVTVFLRETVLYKEVISPLSGGCESWSVTLVETRKSTTLKVKLLRRTFGTSLEDATGGCRDVYNQEVLKLKFLEMLLR
jgi:hypothetical protein